MWPGKRRNLFRKWQVCVHQFDAFRDTFLCSGMIIPDADLGWRLQGQQNRLWSQFVHTLNLVTDHI